MAALKLRPVNHGRTRADKNRYCGPSVISALTGMTSGAAAALLRSRRGAKAIRGTSDAAVLWALERCGISWTRANPWPAKPTFLQWTKQTHGERGGEVFLVVVGNHWVAVSGRRYVCGLTKEVVGFDHDKVKRRARVERVYRLFAPNGVRTPTMITFDRNLSPKPGPEKRQALKLAAAHGIEIDRHTDLDSRPWYVCDPATVDTDADPFDGDHYCYDWPQVLERVEAYVTHKNG